MRSRGCWDSNKSPEPLTQLELRVRTPFSPSRAASRAGRPSIVGEHATDQVFWGGVLRRAGIAPALLHRRTLTAAALGVLTPMPCVPATSAPWIPRAPTALVGGMPALHNGCQCMCMWGGVIAITNPGQVQSQVG